MEFLFSSFLRFAFFFLSFRLCIFLSHALLPFFSFLSVPAPPLKNSKIINSYTKLFGGPEFDAATFYSSFGTTLGIGEARRGGSVDILSLSERGREGPGTPPEKDAVKAQAFSLQVLTSLAVGGRGLAGLVSEGGGGKDFCPFFFFVPRE